MDAEELYAKGQQLLEEGRDQEALTTLEQTVGAYRASGNCQGHLRAIAKIGEVLCRLGQYAQAQQRLEAVVKETDRAEAVNRTAVLTILGRTLQFQGNYDKAEYWLARAAQQAKQLTDAVIQCQAFQNLGIALAVRGKNEGAEVFFRKAVRAAMETPSAQIRSRSMFNLGDLLRVCGKDNEAEIWLRRATTEVEALTSPVIRCDAFSRLGTLLGVRGKFGEAESWSRRSAHEAEKLSDALIRCNAFVGIGDVLQFRGKLSEAETWLRRASDEAKRLSSPHTRCNAFGSLGDLLRARGKLKDAEEWLQLAALEADKTTDALSRSNVFGTLGETLCSQAKYEAAEFWLLRAAREADRSNNPVAQTNANKRLGDLAVMRNRWNLAFQLLMRARTKLLKMLSLNRWPEAVGSVMGAYTPLFNNGLRAAERLGLNATRGKSQMLSPALAFADGAKCVSIREALRRHSHQEGSKTQPVPWQHEPDPWQGAFLPAPTEAGASATRAAVRGLREWSRNRGTNTHELLELPEEKNSGKRAFCRPITRAGVKRLLPDCDTVLIQFFFQGQDLVVLPLRRDAVGKPQLLPTPEGYFRVKKVRGRINRLQKAHEQETRQWLELIAQEPDKAPEALAAQGGGYLRQLYEQLYEDLRLQALLELMEPEPTRRRDLHLVLIPDGPLYLLPLHAAASRKEGKRLYEQVASVRYGLSLRTLELQEQLEAKEAKRRGRSEELRGVAFASPRRREGKKGFLPGVIQEVEVLMQETGSKSWWLHGESEPMAVRQNFHERHRSGNLVWVMGHGGHAWDSFELGGRTVKVREPALQLEDGVVSMGRLLSEGYDFRQAELVHFSCCLLGRLEAVGASKEVLGYVAGLTLLGCRRVCSALWPLVDGVAPEFSRHWIRALRKEVWDARGRPHAYAVAFKRALTRFRKANKGKYDHELFWAPYTLYGLG